MTIASDEQSMADKNLKMHYEHVKTAEGPFLDILDNQFVVLRDSQAVFSFPSPGPGASTHRVGG